MTTVPAWPLVTERPDLWALPAFTCSGAAFAICPPVSVRCRAAARGRANSFRVGRVE
jgi:hypothetical protein